MDNYSSLNLVITSMVINLFQIRALQKKIDDIEKLKKRKESGQILEANQLEKIEKENEIIEELEKLRVA